MCATDCYGYGFKILAGVSCGMTRLSSYKRRCRRINVNCGN